MRLTACMLVCRENELMRRAVESILRQEPDEFRAYVDSYILADRTEGVTRFLEDSGAKVFIQRYDPNREDHHVDVVHSVHRALLEAENKWVAWNDDDDELLSDRRRILEEYLGDDVGVIYGDVVEDRTGVVSVKRTKQIHQPGNVHYMIGSGQIYNRDAFREIHRDRPDPIPDHGYFWDFKVFYWLLRAGYRVVHVPKIMSLQNVNLNPSQIRLKLRGKWPKIVERLEGQEL